LLTVFGACVVTFMMVMYALEGAVAGLCSRSRSGVRCRAAMGFLAGTWPFGIVEGIWSLVAVKRFFDQRAEAGDDSRSADASCERVGASRVLDPDRELTRRGVVLECEEAGAAALDSGRLPDEIDVDLCAEGDSLTGSARAARAKCSSPPRSRTAAHRETFAEPCTAPARAGRVSG
jgi:hypothetical protein